MLKIPPRPIFIEHTKKLCFLTVKEKIYGFSFVKNGQKYETTEIKYTDDIETAVKEWNLKTLIENEDYNEAVAKNHEKGRTEYFMKVLKEANDNNKYNGDFNKANKLQKDTITHILKENNLTDEEIEKLFKTNINESRTKKEIENENNQTTESKDETTKNIEYLNEQTTNLMQDRFILSYQDKQDNYKIYTKYHLINGYKVILSKNDDENKQIIISINPKLEKKPILNNDEIRKAIIKLNKGLNKREIYLDIETIVRLQIQYIMDYYKQIEENNENLHEWIELISHPDKKSLHMSIAIELEEKFNIKKYINHDKPIYYYFNEKENTFNELDKHNLGVIIRKYKRINLPSHSVNSILSCVQRKDYIDNDVWEFINCLFDTISLGIKKIDKKDLLTIKKAGFENKTQEVDMLEFYEDVSFFNDKKNETLTERTLKQILIPKTNQNDTDLYIDFLQRLGACFLTEMNYKTITLYRGEKDNGKTILNLSLEYIFNKYHRTLEPKHIERDQFNLNQINDTHSLSFDELDKNDLVNILTLIMVWTGGATPVQRAMFKDTMIKARNIGMLWIFCNPMPKLPLEWVAIFNRLNVFELPNMFVDKSQVNKAPNYYPINRNMAKDLKKDYKGLSWLASAGIKAYKEMIENKENFRCEQSTDTTMSIINKTDHLKNWLILYTEIDDSERTPNKEMVRQYKEWIDFKGYENKKTDNKIAKEIGTIIKDIYSDNLIVTSPNNKKVYNIKLKSLKEVDNYYKQVWKVTDTYEDIYNNYNLDSDTNLVLNEIKKGNNTINTIINIHPSLRVIEHMKYLENNNMIYNTFEISITEY